MSLTTAQKRIRQMRYRGQTGFTMIKVLVGLGVVAALLYVILPAINGAFAHPLGLSTLSNARQLTIATQQMALDREIAGNRNLGWPGDTGNKYANWVHQLIPAYLSTNDFLKLMSAPDVIQRPGKMPSREDCALLVYAVSSNSTDRTVFLTTANFTNTAAGGLSPGKNAKPYGNKGFVVFRKQGDGAILAARQAGNTNIIGSYAPLLK